MYRYEVERVSGMSATTTAEKKNKTKKKPPPPPPITSTPNLLLLLLHPHIPLKKVQMKLSLIHLILHYQSHP